jgi:hypothetical protein
MTLYLPKVNEIKNKIKTIDKIFFFLFNHVINKKLTKTSELSYHIYTIVHKKETF